MYIKLYYFKTFFLKTKKNDRIVESNSDKNLDELQAYYHSNDNNYIYLKNDESYYSKLNEEENMILDLF